MQKCSLSSRAKPIFLLIPHNLTEVIKCTKMWKKLIRDFDPGSADVLCDLQQNLCEWRPEHGSQMPLPDASQDLLVKVWTPFCYFWVIQLVWKWRLIPPHAGSGRNCHCHARALHKCSLQIESGSSKILQFGPPWMMVSHFILLCLVFSIWNMGRYIASLVNVSFFSLR